MDAKTLIAEVEAAAKEAGSPSVDELCKRVGVHRATWQRWKIGKGEPRLSQFQALTAIRGELLQKKVAA